MRIHPIGEIELMQMKIVERAIRPVRAPQVRKRAMREEMLAHVKDLYEQEISAGKQPQEAIETAAQRFGDPAALSVELASSLTWIDRFAYGLDRFFGWHAPETAGRYLRRLTMRAIILMMCMLAAAITAVALRMGWDAQLIFLSLRPVIAMAVLAPVGVLIMGSIYYRMRDTLLGAFGTIQSTGDALRWAILFAVLSAGFEIAFFGITGVQMGSFRVSSFIACTAILSGMAALAVARANGPIEVADERWELLELD